MRHLILFAHVALHTVALADTADEPSRIPCPFASGASSFDDWSDAVPRGFHLDEHIKTHEQFASRDLLELLEGGHLYAPDDQHAPAEVNEDESAEEASRALKRKGREGGTRARKNNESRQDSVPNKGSEGGTRGRKKKKTKKTNLQKNKPNRQKQKNGKRNKNGKTKRGKKTSKRGKRGSGLGSSSTTTRCFSNR
jgi:hypothetical protein